MNEWAPWLTLASPLLTALALGAGGFYGYGRFRERGEQFEQRVLEKIDAAVKAQTDTLNEYRNKTDKRLDRLEDPYFRSPAVGAAPFETYE